MANISSTATVDLTINGKQAQDAMKRIMDQAVQVRKKMDECVLKGDTKGAERLQRQLDRLQKRYDKLQNSTVEFEHTLKQLDKATPRQLNSALALLQRNLNNLQRGSAEWDKQVAKIRAVKAEMQKLNATLAVTQAESKTLWTRFMNWCNNAQAAVMTVVAAVTTFVMAGRKAVNQYAGMEESMANTEKYTRMTAEEVEVLNQMFKKFDTRLAREQLNLLAQEGGRLGYNTISKVKEYVEAASIINVALVDLGEGATQTIAKISNIFGIEQLYGVRDAMLKVGSTVNHLSQNCTASKPFIVEFAQRLAGIGSTAKMTIPEIMAFGATLDAHGQKVEMSATAIQRTITELFKRPVEMAKIAGMNVSEFLKTLRKDTTQGLIMFLDALNKIGGKKAVSRLAPLFDDLGLDGTRVTAVLSNLSTHIGFLKWQMGEANKAFREGTSAANEYTIFNNTAQASIDKAKNRFKERAIELGEKLYPVMRHIYTSSSIALRTLNVIITFISSNIKVITMLALQITALTLVINAHALATKTASIATKAWLALQKVMPATIALTRAAVAGLGVAFARLHGGLKTNIVASVAWAKALTALRAVSNANIFILMSTAAVALSQIIFKLIKSFNTLGETAKMMNDIRTQAAEKAELEKQKIQALMKAAADHNKTEEHRLAICKKLNEIVPNMSANIDAMTGAFIYSTKAVNDHIKALTHLYEIEGAKEQLKQLSEEKAKLKIQRKEVEKEQENIRQQRINTTYSNPFSANTTMGGGIPGGINLSINTAGQQQATQIKLNSIDNQLAATDDKINTLFDAYGVLELMSGDEQPFTQPEPEDSDFKKHLSDKERRKLEAAARKAEAEKKKKMRAELDAAKADREQADALNISQYTQGLKTYTEFLSEKNRLQNKFFDDQMAVYKKYNLQESDDFSELLRKKEQLAAEWAKRYTQLRAEDLKTAQASEEMQVNIDFNSPSSEIFQNEQVRQQRLFDIKIKYLEKSRDLYARDSDEYRQAQLRLTDALNADRLDKQKKFAEAYKKYSIEYAHKAARERYDYELKLIISLFMMGKLKAQEYVEALKNLRKQYVDSEMPESARRQKSDTETDTAEMQKDLKLLKSQFDQKLITETEYLEARDRLERHYQQRALDRASKGAGDAAGLVMGLYSQFAKFADWDKDTKISDKLQDIGAAAQASYAVMQAAMSQYQEFAEAQNAIDIARIEKRYDLESSLAEGNVYRQKQAEQKKEREIARIKSESSRRAYAMQVISAVAQTAINAINAYGSAAAIPVVGHIIAPIAAAAAVAAGMIQIATLKKQQQQAAATGYREGGFTPAGPADREVGVVHAGEWVAPADMVRDPRTRPIIDLLETARRSNRIGAITYADVSRDRLTASAMTAALSTAAASGPGLSSAPHGVSSGAAPLAAGLTDAITRLNSRLEGPIITVNTVSGDHGYRRAEDEYDRLIKNKSPK